MKKPNKCCGEYPAWWKPCDCVNCQGHCDNVEKIECYKCGRVIYGSSDEEIEQWNNGESD